MPTPDVRDLVTGNAPPPPRQFHRLTTDERKWLAKIAAHGSCDRQDLVRIIYGRMYFACAATVEIIEPHSNRVFRSTHLATDTIGEIEPAGDSAIAVMGSRDGAMIVDDLFFLDARTLKQINKQQMSDTLFLGVIGDRPYLDNLCCFGRSGEYRPATIYTMSLRNGSTTVPVDLRPDADGHAADQDPPGQGDRSYLIGRTFYLVVYDPRYHVDFAYRYDITRLDRPPVRMRAYAPQPPGAPIPQRARPKGRD